MKRIKSIVLIIGIIFIVLSCQNETKKAAVSTQEKPKQNQDSIFINIPFSRNNLREVENNKIYLLSYKEGLNDTIVGKIIVEYLKKYQPLDLYLFSLNEKIDSSYVKSYITENPPNMKRFIDTLSINYDISKKKISQIIFDYKLLQAFEEIEEIKDME